MLRKHDYQILSYKTRYGYEVSCKLRCSHAYSNDGSEDLAGNDICTNYVGGGNADKFTNEELQGCILHDSSTLPVSTGMIYQFSNYYLEPNLNITLVNDNNILKCKISLNMLSSRLTVINLKLVAAVHGIYIKTRSPHQQIVQILNDHTCTNCSDCITVLCPAQSSDQRKKDLNHKAVRRYRERRKINLNRDSPVPFPENKHGHKSKKEVSLVLGHHVFPPVPLDQSLQHSIIQAWCRDMSPKKFQEVGCAVCGELSLESNAILLTDADVKLVPLICSPDITRKERTSVFDVVEGIKGPVLEPTLNHMCNRCHISLNANKLPRISLPNGMWLGHIPSALSDLTFAEQLLVARVRHNRCLVRVSSG
jgi:hypothetical protein